MSEITREPSRFGIAVAGGFALLSITAIAVAVPTAAAISGVGLLVLAAGLARASRRLVTNGGGLLLLGVLYAGYTGAPPLPVLLAALLGVLAWAAASNAVSVGQQLGKETDTTRAEDENTKRGPPAARPTSPQTDSLQTDTLATPGDSLKKRERRARPDSLLHSGPVVVGLRAVESSIPVEDRRLTTSSGQPFEFAELPDGQYRFRAYLDRNDNGRWDGGQVQPYVPAEPVTWLDEPLEARPRWTTELPAPLRIPVLGPRPTPDSRQPDSSEASEQDR